MSGYTTFVVNPSTGKKSSKKPGRKRRTGTGVKKKKGRAPHRYVGAHGVLFDSLSAAIQSQETAAKKKKAAAKKSLAAKKKKAAAKKKVAKKSTRAKSAKLTAPQAALLLRLKKQYLNENEWRDRSVTATEGMVRRGLVRVDKAMRSFSDIQLDSYKITPDGRKALAAHRPTKAKTVPRKKKVIKRARGATRLPPQEVYVYKGSTFYLTPTVDAEDESDTGRAPIEWWADHPGVSINLDHDTTYGSKDALKRAIRAATVQPKGRAPARRKKAVAKKSRNAGRKFAPGQRPNVKVGDEVVVHVEGRKAPFKGRVTDVRPHGIGIREEAPLRRAISVVPRPNGKLDLVFYSDGREYFPGYVRSIEKIPTKAKNMAKPKKNGIALKSLARRRLTTVMTEDFVDMAYEAGEIAGVRITDADLRAVKASARLPSSESRDRSLKKALAAISKRGSVSAAPVRRRKKAVAKKAVAKKSATAVRRAMAAAAKKKRNAPVSKFDGPFLAYNLDHARSTGNRRSGDDDQWLAQQAGMDWWDMGAVWKALAAGKVKGWTAVRRDGYFWLRPATKSRNLKIPGRKRTPAEAERAKKRREADAKELKRRIAARKRAGKSAPRSTKIETTKARNMAKKKKKKFSPAQLAAQDKFRKMVQAKSKKKKAASGLAGIARAKSKGVSARGAASAKKRKAVYGLGAAMTKDVQKALDSSRKMAKASFVDQKRADDAEKKLRSCRARVGAARKRGDLTKLEEERLKKKLELARAALRRCKSKAAKKATKKKAKKKTKKRTKKRAKKKVTKKKKTKKKATKKRAKKKVTKKRATKKRVTKKKVTKRKKRKKLTGSRRVSTKVAAKRKKAQPKKCPTGKKRPVKCKTRPTKIQMDACTQAARRHGKSPSRTCGPGVPRGKKAAAEMGKRKGEIEKRRAALKKRQIAEFMRG